MSKHTPEPWGMGALEEDAICADGGRGLVIYRPAGNRPMSPEDKSRSIACVNALAGIPDPAAFVKAARELAETYATGVPIVSPIGRACIERYNAADPTGC